MKKNQAKLWLGCGIFCTAAMLLSVWYAVTFNDSRLVTPTDLGSYTFTPKDLPMLLSVSLFCCQGRLFGSLEYTLIAAVIVLSLTLALGIFLPEYLLYRYDHDDQTGEGEE